MTPECNANRWGSLVGAFVLGAAAGATFALLTAPRSGRETRQRLKGIDHVPDAIQAAGSGAVTATRVAFEQVRDEGTRGRDHS